MDYLIGTVLFGLGSLTAYYLFSSEKTNDETENDNEKHGYEHLINDIHTLLEDYEELQPKVICNSRLITIHINRDIANVNDTNNAKKSQTTAQKKKFKRGYMVCPTEGRPSNELFVPPKERYIKLIANGKEYEVPSSRFRSSYRFIEECGPLEINMEGAELFVSWIRNELPQTKKWTGKEILQLLKITTYLKDAGLARQVHTIYIFDVKYSESEKFNTVEEDEIIRVIDEYPVYDTLINPSAPENYTAFEDRVQELTVHREGKMMVLCDNCGGIWPRCICCKVCGCSPRDCECDPKDNSSSRDNGLPPPLEEGVCGSCGADFYGCRCGNYRPISHSELEKHKSR